MRYNKRSMVTAVVVFIGSILPAEALAWTGQTWGPMTRDDMVTLADDMIDSTWTPNNTFRVHEYDGPSPVFMTYTKGVTYRGIVYSQYSSPQDNWAEFLNWVSITAGGDRNFGNDCSGFVSICWRLPQRYTTQRFEDEIGTYWDSLGAIGSGQSVDLRPGDALNSKTQGHILLVNRYVSGGIESLEQTPHHAIRRTWTWSALSQYRPIRRKQISDDLPGPPTIQSPGSGSVPGPVLSTLTPTMQWSGVSGAARYGLYISKTPYGASNIIYQNTNLMGTSFTLPGGKLQGGLAYKWNMTSFSSSGVESGVSNWLAFQTAGDTTSPTMSVSSPCSSSCAVSSSSLTITGTASDSGGSGLSSIVALNRTTGCVAANCAAAQDLSGNSSSFNIGPLALLTGLNTICLVVADEAGNLTNPPLYLSITYAPPDTQGPTLQITSHADGQTVSTGSITLMGTATDSGRGDNGISSVRVNGSRASNDTASAANTANWSRTVSLNAGQNSITVVAKDGSTNQNSTTQSITITYVPPDTTPPTVTITNPTSSSTYSTSSATIDLAGSASDNVGVTQVSWSNNKGGNGTCGGTTSWVKSGITLQPGQNLITVTAKDAANNSGTDTLTVTYTPPDTTMPTVTITSPTANSTYNTGNASFDLAGSASDNIGITQITWSNDRGGSGTCSGTTSWAKSGITLQVGTNVITITAKDAANNSGTDTLTVTYAQPDITSPTVTFTSPSNGQMLTNAVITVNGSAADPGTPTSGVNKVELRLNGGSWQTVSGTLNWSSSTTLTAGSNTIEARSSDNAGNISTIASIMVSYNPPPVVTWYRDADGDGFGDPAQSAQVSAQPAGYVASNTDCNDSDAAIHPGTAETCDGKDNNCDGQIDEAVTSATWYRDADGDGYGNPADSKQACSQPVGYVANNTDCNDQWATVHPGTSEVCGNGLDDDCAGGDQACGTWYRDADRDGYGDQHDSVQTVSQPNGYVANDTDCDDQRAAVHPGAAEVCGNGLDDDCQGGDLTCGTWYRDADGDGYGNVADSTASIAQPVGYVSDGTDCNDTNAAVHPGGTDIPNDGIDQDCSGSDATGSGTIDADNDGVADGQDACPGTPLGAAVDARGCATSQRDSDSDGVKDDADQCPGTANGAQVDTRGCAVNQRDNDGDGVTDDSDDCPFTPTGQIADSNGCAASQRDMDQDGVVDSIDQCPYTPANDSPNSVGCGRSQRDTDGDGVKDNVDRCENTPTGQVTDGNGCAASQRDSDNDGVNDAADHCDATSAGQAVDTNGCAASQRDSDGDGIADATDLCPNDPNKHIPGQCGCGTPDIDADGDGLSACLDQCPQDATKIRPGNCGCGQPETSGCGQQFTLRVLTTNGATAPAPAIYASGTTFDLWAPSAPSGFHFSSWSGDASSTDNPLKGFVMDRDKTVTANYAEDVMPAPSGLCGAGAVEALMISLLGLAIVPRRQRSVRSAHILLQESNIIRLSGIQ